MKTEEEVPTIIKRHYKKNKFPHLFQPQQNNLIQHNHDNMKLIPLA